MDGGPLYIVVMRNKVTNQVIGSAPITKQKATEYIEEIVEKSGNLDDLVDFRIVML